MVIKKIDIKSACSCIGRGIKNAFTELKNTFKKFFDDFAERLTVFGNLFNVQGLYKKRLAYSLLIVFACWLLAFRKETAIDNMFAITIPMILIVALIQFFSVIYGGSKQVVYSIIALMSLGTVLQVILTTDASVSDYGPAYQLVMHLAIGVFLGFIICFLIQWLLNLPRRSANIIIGVFAAGLYLTLMLFGTSVDDGTRAWLSVGGFSIQLTEVAKLVGLVQLALLFTQEGLTEWRRIIYLLMTILFHIGCVIVLNELSVAILLVIAFFFMGIAFRSNKQFWLSVLVLAVLGAMILGFCYRCYTLGTDANGKIIDDANSVIKTGTRIYSKINGRFIGFLKPETNGHLTMIKNTLSTCEWFGTDLNLSQIPALRGDCAFLAVLSKYGIVMGWVVLGLWGVITLWGGIACMQKRASDNRLSAISFGCLLCLVVPAFVSIGGSMGVLPLVGIVLPLLADGGSSEFVNIAAFMLVIYLTRKPALLASRY